MTGRSRWTAALVIAAVLLPMTACTVTHTHTHTHLGSSTGGGRGGAEPGDKRFDRFGCYNLSRVHVKFHVTVFRGVEVLMDEHLEVPGGAFEARTPLMQFPPGEPPVTKVTCETQEDGQPPLTCEVVSSVEVGLRSVSFWYAPLRAGTRQLWVESHHDSHEVTVHKVETE